MNRTAAVRDYIAANPGAFTGDVATATGMCPKLISNACRKMARRGLLRETSVIRPGETRTRYMYTTGRDVIPPRERACMSTRKRMERRPAAQQPKLKPRWIVQDTVAPKATARAIVAQTSAEWEAQGGHVEVLPGFRYQAASVRPYGARYG